MTHLLYGRPLVNRDPDQTNTAYALGYRQRVAEVEAERGATNERADAALEGQQDGPKLMEKFNAVQAKRDDWKRKHNALKHQLADKRQKLNGVIRQRNAGQKKNSELEKRIKQLKGE